MKIILILFTVIGTSGNASAGEPEGFRLGLSLGEFGASAFLGAGAAIGGGKAAVTLGADGNGQIAIAGLAYTAGATAGVLLVGELAGAPSANKAETYLWTFGGTLIYPGIITVTKLMNPNSDTAIAGMMMAPVIIPLITTIIYNLVKVPKAESANDNARVVIRPYSGYLADGGGGYITAYGVEISF